MPSLGNRIVVVEANEFIRGHTISYLYDISQTVQQSSTIAYDSSKSSLVVVQRQQCSNKILDTEGQDE